MILSCGIFAEYSSVFQKGGAIWNDHVSTSWQVELLVEEDRVSSSSCLWGNLFAA